MSNKLFKKIAKYAVVIISLLLIPQALNIQSELNMRTIISAVAVDYMDNKFLVTAQVVKPKSTAEGGGTELDFLSASGTTIAEAVDEVTVALGRTAGLALIDTIIIGKDVLTEDKLMGALDYFIREKGIQNSAMLLVSEDKAKTELENTKKLQLSSAVGLPKLFLYKQNNNNGVMMQLQNFMNDYFTVSKCSVISGVKIESKSEQEKVEGVESESSSSSGGSSGGSGGSASAEESSGGGSGGSSGGEKDGRIKYANNIYVFENGKLEVEITDEDAIRGVYLINRNSREGVIAVDNISNEYVNNAKVSMYFRDKKVRVKTDWSGERPKCIFTISTNRNEVYSVETTTPNGGLYETDKHYLTDEVLTAVEQKVKENIMKAFTQCQEKGVDLFQCGNRLYQKNAKKWKEFIARVGEEEYIKNVDIEIKLNINRQI